MVKLVVTVCSPDAAYELIDYPQSFSTYLHMIDGAASCMFNEFILYTLLFEWRRAVGVLKGESLAFRKCEKRKKKSLT